MQKTGKKAKIETLQTHVHALNQQMESMRYSIDKINIECRKLMDAKDSSDDDLDVNTIRDKSGKTKVSSTPSLPAFPYEEVATMYAHAHTRASNVVDPTINDEILTSLRENAEDYISADLGVTDFGGTNASFSYRWKDMRVMAECFPRKGCQFILGSSMDHTTRVVETVAVDSLDITLHCIVHMEWAIPGICLINMHRNRHPIDFKMFDSYYKSLATIKFSMESARDAVDQLKRFFPDWFPSSSSSVVAIDATSAYKDDDVDSIIATCDADDDNAIVKRESTPK